MGWFYDNEEQWKEKGIDYDLYECLECNPQEEFTVENIDKVLAVWEGENDGDDWRWVLRLNDKRTVFLQGGCDYTGWDCQSWAKHVFVEKIDDVIRMAKGDLPIDESFTQNKGLGQLISLMFEGAYRNLDEVANSLAEQLEKGKNITWREKMDEEFKDIPKINGKKAQQ